MAKDVRKAIKQSDSTKASSGQNSGLSRSLSVGFKKSYSAGEQVDITTKRREMRKRLVAAG